MLISQKTDYALRGMLELSKYEDKGPVKIQAVAQAQGVPQRFLEAILSQLKQAGLVQSRRGKDGGYMLARRPGEISVAQIIRAVQGPLLVAACVPGPGREKGCDLQAGCALRPVWDQIQRAVEHITENVTMADIAARAASDTAGECLSYAI